MNKSKVRMFVVLCGMLLGAATIMIVPVGALGTTDLICTGDNPATTCCKDKYSDRYDCLFCCTHTFGANTNPGTDCNNACPQN